MTSVADILNEKGKWIRYKDFIKLVASKLELGERQAYRKVEAAVKTNEILKATLPNRNVIYGLPEFGPIRSSMTEGATRLEFRTLLLRQIVQIQDLMAKGEEKAVIDNIHLLHAMIPRRFQTEEYRKDVENAKEIQKIDIRKEWCGRRVGQPRYREEIVFNPLKLFNAISNLIVNL